MIRTHNLKDGPGGKTVAAGAIGSVGGADGGHRDGGAVVHPAAGSGADCGHLVRVLADGSDPVGADAAVGQLLPVAAQGLALGEGRDADGRGQGDGVLGLVEGGT